MAKAQTLDREIKLKIANSQYEFLEIRSRELGFSSKAELLRLYIVSDMMTRQLQSGAGAKKRRFSLEGIFSGDWQVTEQDFEEVKKIWQSRELQ